MNTDRILSNMFKNVSGGLHPCNGYPLKPHFYAAKLGYAAPIFLIFASKLRLWVLVRTGEAVLMCTPNLCLEQK